MFEYSSLQELIEMLEQNGKYHICVQFLSGYYKNSKLSLKRENSIHATPFCDAMKRLPGGYNRCLQCRQRAENKAVQSMRAFSGICINGLYEHCRPVAINGTVVCIIYVGNQDFWKDTEETTKSCRQGRDFIILYYLTFHPKHKLI